METKNIEKITKEELDKFWDAYREYVFIASSTQDMKSEIIPDFLGYIERVIEEQAREQESQQRRIREIRHFNTISN